MKLIIEGGNTKTDYRLVSNENITKHNTVGFSPHFYTTTEIANIISQNIPQNWIDSDIKEIYYYGSGCGNKEKTEIVKKAISSVFKKSEIYVYSDILAAARALFGKNQGIACILGTGSNSCLYDGLNIKNNVLSLGYILGDEGSGAYLGKIILKLYLQNKLPEDLRLSFEKKYSDNKSSMINKLYSNKAPSKFLASFVPFYIENKNHVFIQNLLKKAFSDFFETQVIIYQNYKSYNLGFVGGLAFEFKDIIKQTAENYGLKAEYFIKKPIENLINYHLNLI